ncbi:MAG: PQQ-dependent sugar dehydrogenase, partial [Flavobacteriales bacterium]|nr:PQQ-dependent sugar dehydrogenase [Flavobacteriales bacterium]
MTKRVSILVAALAVSVALFYGFDNIEAEEAPGKAIYQMRCAACHGLGLEKLVGKPKVNEENRDYLIERINIGNAAVGMPAFKDILSKEEINMIVDYMLPELERMAAEPVVEDTGIYKSARLSYKLEEVVSDLDIPWGMTWLPNGEMLITEREGQLLRVSDGVTYEVAGLPEVVTGEQAGVFDIELHPKYEDNGWI